MNETVKDSDVKAALANNQKVPDYRAVISPKKASLLIVPSLGKFEKDNPVHTNDENLIAEARKNGNLKVVINYEAPDAKQAKAKADPKGSDAPKV